MMDCWINLDGKCLTEPLEGAYGFIYMIVDPEGKFYIGKKSFVHSTKKVLSKKARVASGTRKRIERGTKDSKWQDYYGSCKPLLEYMELIGKDKFKRVILKFCENRQSLAYWEIHYMVEYKVLFQESCWNGNVGGKYYRGRIHD